MLGQRGARIGGDSGRTGDVDASADGDSGRMTMDAAESCTLSRLAAPLGFSKFEAISEASFTTIAAALALLTAEALPL